MHCAFAELGDFVFLFRFVLFVFFLLNFKSSVGNSRAVLVESYLMCIYLGISETCFEYLETFCVGVIQIPLKE